MLCHTATDQQQIDREPVDFGDCSTHRNLTARGRADARAIGTAFRARRLRVGDVLSSPYCHTRQIAALAFGRARSAPTLPVWDVGSEAAIRRHVARFRQLLPTRPAAGTLTVRVTHRDLLTRGIGVELGEGDAAVMLPRGGGRFVLVAVLQPRDWRTR